MSNRSKMTQAISRERTKKKKKKEEKKEEDRKKRRRKKQDAIKTVNRRRQAGKAEKIGILCL